jgi:hypothetical protein
VPSGNAPSRVGVAVFPADYHFHLDWLLMQLLSEDQTLFGVSSGFWLSICKHFRL